MKLGEFREATKGLDDDYDIEMIIPQAYGEAKWLAKSLPHSVEVDPKHQEVRLHGKD